MIKNEIDSITQQPNDEERRMEKTKNDNRDEYLLHGFIRESSKASDLEVPQDLIDIIDMYQLKFIIGDRFETRDRFGRWCVGRIIQWKQRGERLLPKEMERLKRHSNRKSGRHYLESIEDYLVDSEAIFVHYEQWDKRWDEWILIDCSKLFCDCTDKWRHENRAISHSHCHRLRYNRDLPSESQLFYQYTIEKAKER